MAHFGIRGEAAVHERHASALELFFDLWAITVVATLAGSFGAFFHARSKEIDDFEHRMLSEADQLRQRI